MPAAAITRADVERELLRELVAEELGLTIGQGPPVPDDYESWLRDLFPRMLADPAGERVELAQHHHQFWEWVWSLKRGERPRPLVCIWPRGGGKSTSAELACVAVGARDARRYILYVSGTQAQADDHVASVAGLLESKAVEAAYPKLAARSVGLHGNPKGWRRNRLWTEAGLIVDAIGLDTAARGVKLDEARPDLIVLDDVDDTADSTLTIQKKVTAITQKLLPAGSSDAATLFVQNLVHYESVAARLCGRASEEADFLADREVIGPLPALVGFKAERIPGTAKWKIVSGRPIWDGQDLATCQFQVNDWGIKSFRAEAQHERTAPVGQAFPEWDVSVHVVPPSNIPAAWPRYRCVDYGYAAPFCCLWLAKHPDGSIIVYRELYASGLTATEQALQVRALSAGEMYKASIGDPSMWASKREGKRFKSVADQYKAGGVRLTPGTNERVDGWERVHEYLEWEEPSAKSDGFEPNLIVFASCTNLIRTFPMMVRDPNHVEDIDTDLEDHAVDALRYGLMAVDTRTVGGALSRAMAPDVETEPDLQVIRGSNKVAAPWEAPGQPGTTPSQRRMHLMGDTNQGWPG